MVKILVVDDDASTLKSSKRLITSLGHEAFTAQDVNSGLALLLEVSPKMVLLDYNMPEATGYDFCKAVRNDTEYSKVRNVTLIGIGDFPKSETEFLDESMPKPFDVSVLEELIIKYS